MLHKKPKLYSIEEVAKHTTKSSCWIILSNVVYDVAEYAKEHPGGSSIIYENAGKDCTELFYALHPWINYKKILEKYIIGYIEEKTTP
ncbi:hypothetical protein NEPAR06_1191 [Nematocida parisii]|uniref:Cytochrome B5 n=1 Tax=Nematocida parisii (strain ERTm3) TaxID=935791 RepID=I3EK80_NEMP3|nr:cytochrome B5 [Nematocida parisii ERTm1]EIJ89627.1 cytochrome B5 [Nematocida parisii ERTm3]KAI5128604.1 hypothetical protein NEPAR08_1315 [Nematocida parisii]EIJ94171.1 cytochrome B5 [Nematocida parisii ERTm1]KAI5128919.1 hypothetical protein NEPAR03_1410 [Nematocida parisii]KAI5141471.1 hypothetical protein NEPAR04_0972 [Nematocida parisii]|eukprot:XP_013058667.1 cytochrome B5 [Nematocida parisii ERTm1]